MTCLTLARDNLLFIPNCSRLLVGWSYTFSDTSSDQQVHQRLTHHPSLVTHAPLTPSPVGPDVALRPGEWRLGHGLRIPNLGVSPTTKWNRRDIWMHYIYICVHIINAQIEIANDFNSLGHIAEQAFRMFIFGICMYHTAEVTSLTKAPGGALRTCPC